MILLGASSCARKAISWSTEQWRIFVKAWFYLCVCFCHGKYMKVRKTAIFYFTCSIMLQPLVAKIGKGSNGSPHWSSVRHVETMFIKFKLLNAISVQFVDCHVCIMIYYGIAIHNLV